MNRTVQRALVAFVALALLVAVARLVWPHAELLTAGVAPRLVRLTGSLGMLVPLAVGAAYAVGAARRFERGNRARPAWMLLAAWLSCFAVGEAILAFYVHVLGTEPPVPSVGDGFFVVGYLMLVAGLLWFARVYVTSGLPLGPAYEAPLIAGATIALLGVVGALWLAPLARGSDWTAERCITLAYPVLDFVVLVPTAVLARVTSRFRGGRVWTVWGAILAGFVSLAAADTLFAHLDLAGAASLDPIEDVAFIVGYTLTAFGAARQYDLLGE
jgi:hypothetical protein